MKKEFYLICLLAAFFGRSIAQQTWWPPCSHLNSAVNPNYCCGHDPEFVSQTNSHKLFDNTQGGKNFCDNSNFTKEKVNAISQLPFGWILVWYDEFNYNQFDSSFYTYDLTGVNNYGVSAFMGDVPQIITPDNVILSNGKMALTAKHHPNQNDKFPYYPPYVTPRNETHVDYTVGNVSTNMVWPMNSRYQASIKVHPNTPVSFPAWWLFGRDNQEIDIFEYSGQGSNRLLMTYHNRPDGNPSAAKGEEGVNHLLTSSSGDIFADQGFHQYDLIWDKNKVEWWFDANVVHTINKYYWKNNWNSNNQNKKYRENPMNNYNDIVSHLGDEFMKNRHFPDKHPMQMIWDLHLLNGVSPGDVGAGKSMETEFVKIWIRGCYGIDIVTQNNYLETPNTSHGSIIEKGQIVKTQAGTSITIPQYHHAIYAALDEIELNNGFSVAPGGNFFAFITTCEASWDARTFKNDSIEKAGFENVENVVDIQSATSFNSDNRKDITVAYDNEQIKFACASGNIYSLTIQNMQGQIVYVNNDNVPTIKIDKSTFAPAVYTAIIKTATGIDVRKLWIVR